MVVVVALFNVNKGKIDAFVDAAFDIVQATNKEKGCVFYNLHQGIGNENETKFAMLEKWESINHLREHQKTEHIATFRAKIQSSNLYASPMKVFILSDGIFNVKIENIDNGSDPVVNTVIRLGIPEDKIDEFIGLNYSFVQATAREKGCYIYNIHQDTENKTNIFFVEKWLIDEAKKQGKNPIPEKKVFEEKVKKGNLISDGEKFSFGRAIFNVNKIKSKL